jgi:hypothetical protein
LSAELRHEGGPGLLPVERLYLTAGTNTFAFLIPEGFKLKSRTDRSVILANDDYSAQISFSLSSFFSQGDAVDSQACRENLLGQFPGSKIVKNFSAVADNQNGPAFELQAPGPSGTWRRAQIAFIPSHAGVLQFSMVSSPETFDEGRHKLSTVMLTFRASDANGRLSISPISDKL